MATTVLAISMLNEQLYCIHAQHLRPSMAALQDTLVCIYCAFMAALC